MTVNDLVPGGAPEQELCGHPRDNAAAVPLAACTCQVGTAPDRVWIAVSCQVLHLQTRLWIGRTFGCTRDCIVCLMVRPALPTKLPAAHCWDDPHAHWTCKAVWLVLPGLFGRARVQDTRCDLLWSCFFRDALCCPSGDTHLQALELCLPLPCRVFAALCCHRPELVCWRRDTFAADCCCLLALCRLFQQLCSHALSGHLYLTHIPLRDCTAFAALSGVQLVMFTDTCAYSWALFYACAFLWWRGYALVLPSALWVHLHLLPTVTTKLTLSCEQRPVGCAMDGIPSPLVNSLIGTHSSRPSVCPALCIAR